MKFPANISLLPPYSPELNPSENIWQYLHQNQLANHIFENYEAIVDNLLRRMELSRRSARTQHLNLDQSLGSNGQYLTPLV